MSEALAISLPLVGWGGRDEEISKGLVRANEGREWGEGLSAANGSGCDFSHRKQGGGEEVRLVSLSRLFCVTRGAAAVI